MELLCTLGEGDIADLGAFGLRKTSTALLTGISRSGIRLCLGS